MSTDTGTAPAGSSDPAGALAHPPVRARGCARLRSRWARCAAAVLGLVLSLALAYVAVQVLGALGAGAGGGCGGG